MGQAVLLAMAKNLTADVLGRLNIKTAGNNLNEEQRKKLLEKGLIDVAINACVKSPIVEELIFRALPAAFSDKEKKDWIKFGIPSSALFAAAHNIDQDDKPFATDRIPITQFFGGLFYWYLVKEKGLDHSILAHSANNTYVLLALKFEQKL